MNKTSEAKLRSNARYKDRNCKTITMSLCYNTDGDLIEYLTSMENRQGYLRQLIRNDMERKSGNGKT